MACAAHRHPQVVGRALTVFDPPEVTVARVGDQAQAVNEGRNRLALMAVCPGEQRGDILAQASGGGDLIDSRTSLS